MQLCFLLDLRSNGEVGKTGALLELQRCQKPRISQRNQGYDVQVQAFNGDTT